MERNLSTLNWLFNPNRLDFIQQPNIPEGCKLCRPWFYTFFRLVRPQPVVLKGLHDMDGFNIYSEKVDPDGRISLANNNREYLLALIAGLKLPCLLKCKILDKDHCLPLFRVVTQYQETKPTIGHFVVIPNPFDNVKRRLTDPGQNPQIFRLPKYE